MANGVIYSVNPDGSDLRLVGGRVQNPLELASTARSSTPWIRATMRAGAVR